MCILVSLLSKQPQFLMAQIPQDVEDTPLRIVVHVKVIASCSSCRFFMTWYSMLEVVIRRWVNYGHKAPLCSPVWLKQAFKQTNWTVDTRFMDHGFILLVANLCASAEVETKPFFLFICPVLCAHCTSVYC